MLRSWVYRPRRVGKDVEGGALLQVRAQAPLFPFDSDTLIGITSGLRALLGVRYRLRGSLLTLSRTFCVVACISLVV